MVLIGGVWSNIYQNGHTSNDLCGNLINVMGNNIFDIDEDDITIDCNFIVLTNYTEILYENMYGKKYEQSTTYETVSNINNIITPTCENITFNTNTKKKILYFDKEYLTLKQNYLYENNKCDISEVSYSAASEEMFNLTIESNGYYIENISLPYKRDNEYTYNTMFNYNNDYNSIIYDRFNNCIKIEKLYTPSLIEKEHLCILKEYTQLDLNNTCIFAEDNGYILTHNDHDIININEDHPIGFNQNVSIQPENNIIVIKVYFNENMLEYNFKDENDSSIILDHTKYGCFKFMYNKTYRFVIGDSNENYPFMISYKQNDIIMKTTHISKVAGGRDNFNIIFNYDVSDIFYYNEQETLVKKKIQMLKRKINGENIYYYYGKITISSIRYGSGIYCYNNDGEISEPKIYLLKMGSNIDPNVYLFANFNTIKNINHKIKVHQPRNVQIIPMYNDYFLIKWDPPDYRIKQEKYDISYNNILISSWDYNKITIKLEPQYSYIVEVCINNTFNWVAGILVD